jgi:hypothetical protein
VFGGELLLELVDGDLEVHGLRIKVDAKKGSAGVRIQAEMQVLRLRADALRSG